MSRGQTSVVLSVLVFVVGIVPGAVPVRAAQIPERDPPKVNSITALSANSQPLTVTRAYITHLVTNDGYGMVDPAETKLIAGLSSTMVYGVLQAPGQEEVVRANIYYVSQPDAQAPDTVLAATATSFAEGRFSAVWDASSLPEAEYLIFATALDLDGNEGSKREATKVRVRIDRIPPMVNYTSIGSYAGFTAAVPYIDDGIANHNSMVILPDPFTEDVMFTVTTPSDATHPFDVASVVLEWRYPGDPAGSWRPAGDFFAPTNGPNGMFNYEPNQDFVVEGVTHHVWWLHLEDFADESRLLQTGRMEFRALTTDLAGNTNALQTDVAAYTADNTAGTGVDWTDDSPSDTLQTGDTITFEITVRDGGLADSTRTDITQVALVVREKRSPTPAWPSPYATLAPDSSRIDTGDAIWVARFAWTAPIFVMHDTAYEFGVVLTDAAGNTNIVPWQSPGYLVTVEDTAAPARTKIIDVVGLTQEAAEVGGNPYNPDVWMDMSTIPAQMTTFQLGTDWLISAGGSLTPPSDGTQGTAVGDACATTPRNVGEVYLNDTRVPRTVKVARTVTVVGRTQSEDDDHGGDGTDAGIRWVTFLLAPCDANGVLSTPSEWITLGRDEYPPGFPLYYWHLVVNTTLYVDGTYKLAAYAQDASGNVEDLNALEWTSAIIVIDGEGPSAQMDANPSTEVVENTATVERNLPFTLFARTLVPGTATPQNYESDTVEFFYKRGQDLNVPQSWVSVPADPNLPGEDGNPDVTRPYSLDVNPGRLWDPGVGGAQVPLAVGATYDFVTQVSDDVCNATTYLETYDDSLVAGVGRRYIRLLIQDTIAPHFVFTRAVRRGGDETVIESPTTIHARGFQEITARVLTGDLDVDHVEFVYRLKNTSAWNLIDADVASADHGREWSLGEWDLQTLQHNTWYEMACIGVDNFGNMDGNPGIIEVYVDMAEPSAALTQPVDGDVFGYGAQILLSGTALGDYIPERATDEVDLVRFQAAIYGHFYVDETAGDIGHAGAYDNGVDEVWFDRDGDRLLSQADSCLYPGADGACFSFPQNPGGNKNEPPQAQFWFDLDPTPQDNSDDPWLTEANNGELWEVTWLPSGLSFVSVCGFGDKYVRLRMLSRDTAGNWDTEADLLGPRETMVILNDDWVSGAYITHLVTPDEAGAVDSLGTNPVRGADPIPVYGLLAAPCRAEVVRVNIYAVANADGASPETLQVATADTIDGDMFAAIWDATTLADAEYLLFATAVDIDQNESNKHDAGKIRVRIDRGPSLCNREIPLRANRWEWIGLGLHPENPDAGSVFGSLGTNLRIAKDDQGHVYIPSVYDDLSPLGVERGYAVFLGDADAALEVIGTPPSLGSRTSLGEADNTADRTGSRRVPVQDCISILSRRWNLIPYLTDSCDVACALDIGAAMGAWADSIIIVQNGDGDAWIPEPSIDTIGMLDPRVGYYLFPRATTNFDLCYPSCGYVVGPPVMGVSTGTPVSGGAGLTLTGDPASPNQLNFYQVRETGLPEIVLVTETSVDLLSEGDEVAVICDSLVVGAVRFQGSWPLVVPVWRGSADLGLPGFTPGAPMTAELWDHETDGQVALLPVTEDGQPATFRFDPFGRVRLDRSDPSATSDRPAIGGPAILWARPNPSRGFVEIACGLSRVGGLPELEIYDPAGRLVRRLQGTPREGLLRATWDGMTESGSRVGSGVYFVRLKSGAKGSEQRLLVLR